MLDSLKITPLLTAPPALNHLCGFSKPSAEIYHLACSQADTDPSRSLMIGDELIACVFPLQSAFLQPARKG